jgi:hypothetical protein
MKPGLFPTSMARARLTPDDFHRIDNRAKALGCHLTVLWYIRGGWHATVMVPDPDTGVLFAQTSRTAASETVRRDGLAAFLDEALDSHQRTWVELLPQWTPEELVQIAVQSGMDVTRA